MSYTRSSCSPRFGETKSRDVDQRNLNRENGKVIADVDKAVNKLRMQIEDQVIPKVTSATESFPSTVETDMQNNKVSASLDIEKANDAFQKTMDNVDKDSKTEVTPLPLQPLRKADH